MAPFEPGLPHVWWTNYLLRQSSAANLVRATRRLGWLRYCTGSRHQRREMELHYEALLARMQRAGLSPFEAAVASDFTRQHYLTRPLLAVAGAVILHAREALLNELLVLHDYHNFQAAMAHGKGAVVVSTHFGATGAAAAYHRRHGIAALTIRDRRFERFVGTRHGEHYFAGADVAFIDHNPATSVAVLRRCVRALQAGGTVNYVCDAYYGAHESPGILFGKDIRYRIGPIGAARLAGSPVVPVFSWFADDRIHISYRKPMWISKPADELDFGSQFSPLFETAIRTSPASLAWSKFDLTTFPASEARKTGPDLAVI